MRDARQDILGDRPRILVEGQSILDDGLETLDDGMETLGEGQSRDEGNSSPLVVGSTSLLACQGVLDERQSMNNDGLLLLIDRRPVLDRHLSLLVDRQGPDIVDPGRLEGEPTMLVRLHGGIEVTHAVARALHVDARGYPVNTRGTPIDRRA